VSDRPERQGVCARCVEMLDLAGTQPS